jgi:hypothetical protein
MKTAAALAFVATFAACAHTEPAHGEPAHAEPAPAEPQTPFQVPAGWTVDAREAKERQAEFYAADTRTQPPAEVSGLRLPMALPLDEPGVRGFITGLKRTVPGFREVKHEIINLDGVRAARVIAEVTAEGVVFRQAYYAIPDGGQTMCLIFLVPREGFAKRLASFDAIARSTRGLPAAKH